MNLTGDSFLSSDTWGQGNAGNITINGEGATILIQGGENSDSQISTSNNATGNAGDINIKARRLSLEDGGFLRSNTLGQGNAGNITIDVDENISLANGSYIGSAVSQDAVGQGGQINLTAKSVSLSEISLISTATLSDNEQSNGGNIEVNVSESLNITTNSFLSSITDGKSNAGNITINGDEATILVQGRGNIGDGANISNSSGDKTTGNAGDIKITGRSLALKDGAFFDSSTSGQGDSGKISITTDEAVTLSGAGTSISNTVNRGAIGNSQGISIEAESLSITDGAQIQTLVRGASENNPAGIGNAGSININTDNAVNIVGGSIRSSLGTDAEGSAGDIKIEARSLSLEDGAVVNSSTFGQGDSGRISITTDEAITLSITGTRIRSIVGTNAAGKAGDITIQGRSLSLDNGASLNTSTFGNGNSGIVSLKTDESITLSGAGTTIFNNVERGGVGNSQGISIEAESLSIIDGAQIQTLVRRASEANPAGVGNGGTINIKVRDGVNLSGIGVNSEGITVSSLISSALGTGAEGKAGDINITARKLSLENGARLSTSSGGQGDAGNINLDIQETFNLSGFAFNSDETIIFSTSVRSVLEAGAEGKAGDINLKARSLSLENGAILNNSSFGVGDAGNITLDIQDAVNLSGFSPNSNRTGILSSQITSLLGTNAIGTAGNINIKARTLSLDNGGSLNNSSSGIGNAGDITLDIQDTVNISGFALNSDGTSAFSSQVRSRLETGANGKAGNIHIKARTLSLEDRGQINNNTFGIGNAGNIDINVDDSINLFRSSFITNSVGQGGVGNGGNLDIEARSLTLTEGSQITTVVFRAGVNTPGGEGKGGDIRITATDFVDISGVGSVQLNIPDTSNDPSNTTGLIPTAGFSSGLFAATQRGATGDGGSISVTTDVFRISDGAVVDNSTTNDSNAGDITINANTFEATGGGQVITATRGSGNAADIKLNITDNIFISGSDPNFTARLARANEFGSIQGGENIVTNQGAASGIFANTSADSTGDGGSISIGIFQQQGENLLLAPNQFTQEVTLANGARITADSQGEGNGGVISLQAQHLTLDNQAEILAETTARQGNNTARSEINLTLDDILQLKNDSRISTQAFSNADGGNINIDAKFIIAFPGQNEGSDILTRAEQEGTGGDINITTEALLGIQERKATPGNETNDIDASSEFGLSGEVSIEQPGVDPTSGLVELTQEVVDASKLIAQNVCTQTANSEFVDIGKGGLPQNPDDVLAEDMSDVGLVAPVTASEAEIESNRKTETVKPKITTRKPPAQGWIWHEDGSVELVAYNPHQAGEQRTWDNHRGCQ